MSNLFCDVHCLTFLQLRAHTGMSNHPTGTTILSAVAIRTAANDDVSDLEED